MAGAEMDFPKLRPGSDVYLIEDRETELPIPTWMADAELDFSKPWPGSDVTFLIEGKKVYANKLILSMWSPVMEAMFTSEFKEKDTAEIPLPQKNYIDFLQLMKAVHPPNTQITGTVILLKTKSELSFLCLICKFITPGKIQFSQGHSMLLPIFVTKSIFNFKFFYISTVILVIREYMCSPKCILLL